MKNGDGRNESESDFVVYGGKNNENRQKIRKWQ